MELLAGEQDPPRPFRAALQGDDVALIAEIKKASPSKGIARRRFRSDTFGCSVPARWSECNLGVDGRKVLSGLIESLAAR